MDYGVEIAKLADVPENFDLSQYVLDAGTDVINNVAKFNPQDLNMFTTAVPINNSSGLNLETGIVHFVERKGKTCMEIDAAKKNVAADFGSLEYASSEYPVFYRKNKKLFVLPEPNELSDPLSGYNLLFSKSTPIDEGEDILVNISFTTSGDIENAIDLRQPHNLLNGDIISISNNGEDTTFNAELVNVVRVDEYTVTIGLDWEDPPLQAWSTIEESDITYYFYNLLTYKATSPMSIAHTIEPLSFKGRLQASEGLYYKYRADEFKKEPIEV